MTHCSIFPAPAIEWIVAYYVTSFQPSFHPSDILSFSPSFPDFFSVLIDIWADFLSQYIDDLKMKIEFHVHLFLQKLLTFDIEIF